MAHALGSVLQLVLELHGTQQGLLTLCDADGHLTDIVAHAGLSEAALAQLAALAPNESVCSAAALQGEGMAVEDVLADARFAALRPAAAAAGFRAIHSTLLASAGGARLGVMSVLFAQPQRPDERQRQLAEICAVTAAALIDREGARDAACATSNASRSAWNRRACRSASWRRYATQPRASSISAGPT